MKAIWSLGFRPFFLGAMAYATLATLLWTAFYLKGWSGIFGIVSPVDHAHEMIYGYGLAVAVGFLLTAVPNWTGIATAKGWKLALLFGLWVAARLAFLAQPAIPVFLVAGLDLGFNLLATVLILAPLVRARQRRQIGIAFKMIAFLALNACFYAERFGWIDWGSHWSNRFGLYVFIALFLTVGRRVLPFFIERGVDEPVAIRNSALLDGLSLACFPVFALADVIRPESPVSLFLAGVLFVVHALRVSKWHVPGIWKKPLLWSLYLSYLFTTLGFAFKALVFFGFNSSLALHVFALGGIGLSTLSMMPRVSLGHTGRSVRNPPALLVPAFFFMIVAILARSLLPALFPAFYPFWLGTTQVLWTLAFATVLPFHLSILFKPRIDEL